MLGGVLSVLGLLAPLVAVPVLLLAGLVTGGALLAAGLGMVLAQALVVPRSAWDAPTLLRVGSTVALAGLGLLLLDAGAVPLLGAVLLIGLGIGIAMPGYTAGPTLLVRREEQGGLAGLVGATTGLTFVVAPTAGTALYSLWAPLPVLAGGVIMAGVVVLVLVQPRYRRASGPVRQALGGRRPARTG